LDPENQSFCQQNSIESSHTIVGIGLPVRCNMFPGIEVPAAQGTEARDPFVTEANESPGVSRRPPRSQPDYIFKLLFGAPRAAQLLICLREPAESTHVFRAFSRCRPSGLELPVTPLRLREKLQIVRGIGVSREHGHDIAAGVENGRGKPS